ncbi:MAG: hypothetical protein L6Q35_16010, partial [Phycisphaerales bacterium]|nr:hypothetical protein [Phycisphaerales bacterium]
MSDGSTNTGGPAPGAPAAEVPDPMATVSPIPLPLPASQRVYEPGKEPPSILILTKDEEINIEACLDTLTFSDDIVVFDS